MAVTHYSVFDVIERSGRFMGSVRFPVSRTMPVAADGRSVWVIETTEFDVEHVVRYRIEGNDSI